MYNFKKAQLTGSLLAVILAAVAFLVLIKAKNYHLNTLTFSNTIEWDADFLKETEKIPTYLPDFRQNIILTPPPANSSTETRKEVETLLKYQNNRTIDQLLTIKDQVFLGNLNLIGHPLKEYLDSSLYPKTAPLLASALKDLTIIIFYEKYLFDRVRPSALDDRIVPAIVVPGHPAYPSGHSSQAHFLALFFGELEPEVKEKLWEDADKVALNREIAGLHYPSDSKAGAMLARQVFNALMKNPEFLRLFEEAKAEWSLKLN